MDAEIQVLAILISMLDKVFISVANEDKRLWSLDPKGRFSIKSFYDVLIGVKPIVVGWKCY